LISSRFRRFAIVSLVGNLIAAVAMVALYHYVALQNFEEIRAEQNMELARSLSNTIVDEVAELHALAATSSWAELQASPEIARFAENVEREIEQLQILELNVFDPSGLVLYSTERQRIGARVLMNAGVERAAAGEEVSAIVRQDSFNRFDRVVEDQDMVESYLPLIDDAGNVIGVFEIHSDVTGFYERLLGTQRIVVIAPVSLFAAAGLVLAFRPPAVFGPDADTLFPAWQQRVRDDYSCQIRIRGDHQSRDSHTAECCAGHDGPPEPDKADE